MMEKGSIEIHYRLEPQDILAYKKNARIYSHKVINALRLITSIFTVISFIIFYGPDLFRTLVNTFFTSFVVFPLVERYSLYARHKLALKLNTAALGEKHISINQGGITLSSATKSLFQEWSSVIRIVKNDSYYFIYDQDEHPYIIPIRELSSENEQQLNSLLVEKVKPIMQQESSSNQEKLTKLRLILLFFFVSLAIINQLEDTKDPLSLIKRETYDLFQLVDYETEIKVLLNQELIIKESVTQEDIDKLYNKLSRIDSKNASYHDKIQLASLIKLAEQLIYDDLPNTTQTYNGEGKHWKVVDYKIQANPVLFRTYAGKMYMKGQDVFEADYFKTEVYITFDDNKEIRLHQEEFSAEYPDRAKPEELEISEQSTGEFPAQQEFYRNKNGNPVCIEDINQVFVLVQWKGKNESELKEEKIILSPADQ